MTMETFKSGDKVTHSLHGKGRVANSYPEENLVQVFFEGQSDQTLVHPVSLTRFVDPWRPVSVKWTSGVTTNTRVRESELVQYIKNLPIDQIDTLDIAAKQ
jgi:hypothetical protein